MNIIDEAAYNRAINEIARLQEFLRLRDTQLSLHKAEFNELKTQINELCHVIEEILEEEHYPANAPLRKLVAEARKIAAK